MPARQIDYEAATAMIEGGMRPGDVADRFGVTRQQVYRAQKRGKLPKAPRGRPPMSPPPDTEATRATPDVDRLAAAIMAPLLEFVQELDARVMAAIEPLKPRA